MDVPIDVPWVINVGNLYPVKGQRNLIKAFAKVHESFPTALLSIVGRGDLERELKNEIAKLALENNVILHGFKDNVNKFLCQGDLFVLASLSEGLPISILEAMASGVPVISSDVGGIRELVSHNETGLLVPAGDEKALADAIISTLSNPSKGLEMTKNASRMVEKRFSVNKMVSSYQDLYDRLINN
jgi:glycosyltransferase involved in cell wall biosynthesis